MTAHPSAPKSAWFLINVDNGIMNCGCDSVEAINFLEYYQLRICISKSTFRYSNYSGAIISLGHSDHHTKVQDIVPTLVGQSSIIQHSNFVACASNHSDLECQR